MGQVKNYLLRVLSACSEENFGQDAIQHAIDQGYIVLSGNFERDTKKIMAEYDALCEEYQRELNRQMALEPMQPEYNGPQFDTTEEAA